MNAATTPALVRAAVDVVCCPSIELPTAQLLAAWQVLVDTDYVWTMPPQYANTARLLIANHLVRPNRERSCRHGNCPV